MKKVLALVLAVMMLSTMAFASSTGNPSNPSGEITDEDNTVRFGGSIAPGDCLYVYKGMAETVPGTDASSTNTVPWNAQITSDNYSITSQKWTKGKNLLVGLEFDDDLNQLVIKTKEDYELKQPQELNGKFTLKGKGKAASATPSPSTSPLPSLLPLATRRLLPTWMSTTTVLSPRAPSLTTLSTSSRRSTPLRTVSATSSTAATLMLLPSTAPLS